MKLQPLEKSSYEWKSQKAFTPLIPFEYISLLCFGIFQKFPDMLTYVYNDMFPITRSS